MITVDSDFTPVPVSTIQVKAPKLTVRMIVDMTRMNACRSPDQRDMCSLGIDFGPKPHTRIGAL